MSGTSAGKPEAGDPTKGNGNPILCEYLPVNNAALDGVHVG